MAKLLSIVELITRVFFVPIFCWTVHTCKYRFCIHLCRLNFVIHFSFSIDIIIIFYYYLVMKKKTYQSDIYQKNSNFTFNMPITKSLKLILLYTMIKKMHDKVISKSILIIFQCLAFKLYSSVRYFTCKNTFCILSICLLLHFQMCKNYAQHRNCTSYCLKRNDKTHLVNAMNINMPTSVYFNFNI